MNSLNNPYAPLDRISRQEFSRKGGRQMGILLIISAIAAGGIAFLIYFGFALWRDARHAQEKRVLVLKLRETITRKRHQPRLFYMHKLDAIHPASDRRMER